MNRWRVAAALVSVALMQACAGRQATSGSSSEHERLLADVAAHPNDSGANLRLARYAWAAKQPGAALRHFAVVEANGGLFGTRWTNADREHFGSLLRSRGEWRLRHHLAGAQTDLAHARTLGTTVPVTLMQRSAEDQAWSDSRHAADDVRQRGLQAACKAAIAVGACASTSATQRAAFAAALWQHGAKRAAYEVLHEVANRSAGMPAESRMLWLQTQAWWTGAIVPMPITPTTAVCEIVAAADAVWPARGIVFDTAVQRGIATLNDWRARHALPPSADDAALCQPMASESAAPTSIAPAPFEDAFAARWELPADAVLALRRLHQQAPVTIDRAVAELLDAALDEAWTAAAVGELFDLLGDPARARRYWQLAVDANADPAFVQGLAVAAARVGDPDAAAIWATQAAAASGDPALWLLEIANAMAAHGSTPEALTVLKQARAVAGAGDAAAIEAAIQRVQHDTEDTTAAASATLDLRDSRARAWLRSTMTP